jgi:aminopeptidase C
MIDATGLKTYTSGIWNGTYVDEAGNTVACSSEQSKLNHVVLITGVEVDPSTNEEFYRVMNSWGPQWGESGFFRLSRKANICGMSICASYPILTPY